MSAEAIETLKHKIAEIMAISEDSITSDALLSSLDMDEVDLAELILDFEEDTGVELVDSELTDLESVKFLTVEEYTSKLVKLLPKDYFKVAEPNNLKTLSPKKGNFQVKILP